MTNEKSLARRIPDLPPQPLDFDETLDRLAGDPVTIELRIEASGRESIAG